MGRIRAFLVELRRRHVFRVAAWYAIASWLVIQVAVNTFPSLLLPDWAVRLVIVLCLIGFPIALVLAWAYELTPDGVRPASAPMPDAASTRWFGASMVLALAAGALLGVGALQAWRSFIAVPEGELGLAVMPFDNLSPDAADAYFADGIHEELLSRLAALHGVRVVSRTSVVAYKGLNKSAQQIGRELEVSHVLEGSVRRAGDRFVLTAQLIDARRDAHLWTESYEGEITEVFAAQRSVAERVVAALRHELTPSESEVIGAVATHDPEAYALYLNAKAIMGEAGDEEGKVPRVRHLLDQALAHDPKFADAHAVYAIACARMMWSDPSTSNRELALSHLALAEALAPTATETMRARALVGYAVRGALTDPEPWRVLLERIPNDAETMFYLGLIAARQGDTQGAVRWLERALEVAPLDPDSVDNVARRLFELGDRPRERAIEAVDRAASMLHDDVQLSLLHAQLTWRMGGDGATLRRHFAEDPSLMTRDETLAFYAVHEPLGRGRVDEALQVLTTVDGRADFATPYWPITGPKTLRMLLGRMVGPIDPKVVAAAHDEANAYFARHSADSRSINLNRMVIALAFDGRIEEAWRLNEQDASSNEGSAVAWRRPALTRAVLLALKGDHDGALAQLDKVTGKSNGYTPTDLRAGQYLFPALRGNPRFQALLGEPVPALASSD